MNALVAYFSASGTTAKAAKVLAKAAGADLYEIKPAVPYTSTDLNWMDKRSRSSVEMNDKHSRPALADTDAPVAGYDVIFLGFPIWWYTTPTIINTFLESYDFSGKTIVPFCTSASDSIDNSLHIFSELCPEAILAEGLTANDEADIEPWLQGLGLLP